VREIEAVVGALIQPSTNVRMRPVTYMTLP
jgi:hypothetical protein